MIIVDIVSYPYFNPRSHEGSDRTSEGPSGRSEDFNPRSHEGSDSNIAQNNEFILWNIDK